MNNVNSPSTPSTSNIQVLGSASPSSMDYQGLYVVLRHGKTAYRTELLQPPPPTLNSANANTTTTITTTHHSKFRPRWNELFVFPLHQPVFTPTRVGGLPVDDDNNSSTTAATSPSSSGVLQLQGAPLPHHVNAAGAGEDGGAVVVGGSGVLLSPHLGGSGLLPTPPPAAPVLPSPSSASNGNTPTPISPYLSVSPQTTSGGGVGAASLWPSPVLPGSGGSERDGLYHHHHQQQQQQQQHSHSHSSGGPGILALATGTSPAVLPLPTTHSGAAAAVIPAVMGDPPGTAPPAPSAAGGHVEDAVPPVLEVELWRSRRLAEECIGSCAIHYLHELRHSRGSGTHTNSSSRAGQQACEVVDKVFLMHYGAMYSIGLRLRLHGVGNVLSTGTPTPATPSSTAVLSQPSASSSSSADNVTGGSPAVLGGAPGHNPNGGYPSPSAGVEGLRQATLTAAHLPHNTPFHPSVSAGAGVLPSRKLPPSRQGVVGGVGGRALGGVLSGPAPPPLSQGDHHHHHHHHHSLVQGQNASYFISPSSPQQGDDMADTGGGW